MPTYCCVTVQAVFEGSDYVYHVPTTAAFMTINDEKCHAVESAIKVSALHEAIYRENRVSGQLWVTRLASVG